jgi:hypothetical protein
MGAITTTVEMTANSFGGQSVSERKFDARGALSGTTQESVGGVTHGVITAATYLAAGAADRAIDRATDILETVTNTRVQKEINGVKQFEEQVIDGVKTKVPVMENAALSNLDIAKINSHNKQASIALAMNQSFTSLLNKVERTVSTS